MPDAHVTSLPPSQAARLSLLVRATLAFVFVYHGVVPKLVTRDPDELAMLAAIGLSPDGAGVLLMAIGVAEVLWGLAFLVLRRVGWLMLSTAVVMIVVLGGVAVTSPRYLTSAFNPVTLNLSVAVLALVGWLLSDGSGAGAPGDGSP
jgi:hypothetical protein